MQYIDRYYKYGVNKFNKLYFYFLKKVKRFRKDFVEFYRQEPFYVKAGSVFLALLILFSVFMPIFQGKAVDDKYDISKVQDTLLTNPIDLYAEKLVYDEVDQKYTFNQGYTAGGEVGGQTYAPKITAEFSAKDNSVSVQDPVNNVNINLKPKFGVDAPKKSKNFVIFPIKNKKASTIFTLQGSGVKEDIVLFQYSKNTLEFDYELNLSDGLEARVENDGSLGVYGVDGPLLGNVSTGNENDAELLRKARENGPKNKLIFRVPAPFIVEGKKATQTNAKAWFSLNGNVLTVHATNLKNAKYPLSIDPSVYVETAQKLMRGNNESNIEFDVTNELIQKGRTTGGRFDSWLNTLSINDNRWNAATAVAGGYVYSVGGSKSDTSMYTTAGTTTYVVPAGVSSITIKSWGAGGAGGGSSSDRAGGAGGGGGYVASTLTVTAGEVLTIYVGGGGKGGRYTAPDVGGDGGGGGGYSGIFRSSTPLVIAAGGGGGGGGNGDSSNAGRAAGSAGGAGGGTSGVAGSGNGSTTGGGAGTPSAGGSAGSSTTSGGTGGSSLLGGAGASLANVFRTLGGSNGGGVGGNGNTGTTSAEKRPAGGGGGGGYYGGGGGGSGNADYNGGGGGGGASSYTTGTSTTNTAGSGTSPGNSGDGDRNSVGDGGGGGSATAGPNQGTNGDDGSVLITVSGANAVATGSIYWAKFNTSSYAVQATNPGSGTCTNWCTNSAYDLPSSATLSAHSLVAYNGFLYAIGGQNNSGTRQSTVYISKLGANGEPQLWHPTDTNKNNWVYWYSSTNSLSSATTYLSAVAYNNRLYRFGGETSGTVTTATGTTTVEYADIKPTGDISSWSATGMVALTSNRHHNTTLVYNDRIYMIGGLSGTASTANLLSSVQYIKLASDGSMTGSWITTNAFSAARMSWGGSFSTIWGGYIYVAGGCTAITSGYCSTVASDVQLNSINADGTLADWNTILNVSNQRTGQGLVAWRNGLYMIGGCKNQNTSTGVCTWGTAGSDYASINQDGDASTVSNSVASGTSPCSGGAPIDCNIPPEGSGSGQGGNMSGGAVINNGIIYYVGGCTAVGSGSICFTGNAGKASDNTFYASIASDGTLGRVGTCGGSFVDSWCVDDTNSLASGLAGFSVSVFNNVLYAIGGTDGSDWQANVYYNVLNSNGTLGTWTGQTFANLDSGSARGYTYAFTRANPSSASTYPGNLYILGGCAGSPTTDNGVDCTDVQYTDVYKCNITTTGALETADANDCTTSGQLQIDAEPGTGGSQGLGVMSGALYANYIYLVGGQSPNESARGAVMYAKIDNSNNIVDADGETVIDNIWTTDDSAISPVRRRGLAFGYNGYLYALTGYNSGETLNDLLFAKIDVSDGSIGTFTQSAVSVLPRWDSSGIVNNGYVYTLGGCSSGVPPQNCVTMTRTVQTFQLYNNYSGAPASFSNGTAFTTDRSGVSSTVYNGYIYIAGGCTTTTDCTTATDNVQFASIGADGVIGTWANTNDSTLPATRAWGQLEVAGGTLYYIGGQTSGSTNGQTSVYYGTPNGSGDVTIWNTASNVLPSARTKHGATVWNNRLYVTGGLDGSSAVSSTVYVSPSLSSGGDISSAWSSSTAFNVARLGATAIAYANNLYVLGGNDGTNYLNDVQYTQINSDGTVDSWNYSSSLPTRLSEAEGFAANGYMYLLGGRTAATTCPANIIVAPISANTTIASGNNPTGLGAWFETNKRYTTDRYGAAAVYYQGKAYVLGGVCNGTFATTTAQVQQTTLLSQPQIAKYSRMIDTDTDVFPTKWLMNGLDNSTGAEWYMRYRSMHDLDTLVNPNEDCGTSSTMAQMTTWGQETNFGKVTLGNPETYTAKESGGGNINCARYYYFSVTIDSQSAYGYPEDVTRGPTIADLSLFFTSDPSKRLRHGKTFTGGEQQPLNTPF